MRQTFHELYSIRNVSACLVVWSFHCLSLSSAKYSDKLFDSETFLGTDVPILRSRIGPSLIKLTYAIFQVAFIFTSADRQISWSHKHFRTFLKNCTHYIFFNVCIFYEEKCLFEFLFLSKNRLYVWNSILNFFLK